MRWCPACRQQVVRRSARWARAIAILATLGVGLWIALTIRPTRFMVVWMAILIAIYVLVSRIVQRVAFEIIRARGVPAPEEKHPQGHHPEEEHE
jgi:hypothetical protein